MSWKVVLGVTAGVVAGGALGYAIARSRMGQQAIGEAEEAIRQSDLRLPDPSFAVELPYEDGQFDLLEELICQCGGPAVLAADADEDATIDEVAAQVQDCIVRQLYPEFPWPTIPGDHPSVAQLYTEVGVLVRKALVHGEICPAPPRIP